MDTKKDIYISNKDDAVSIFLGNNPSLLFILKKAEKLSGALYILAGFIPKDDPIADSLKRHSLSILSYITRSVVARGKWSFEVGQGLKEIIVEIISLVEVASMAGFISSMNKGVIVAEFNNLILAVDKEGSKNDFLVSDSVFQSSSQDLDNYPHFSSQKNVIKGGLTSYHKGQLKNNITSNQKIEGGHKRRSRREEILNIFKKENKPMSVKDVNVYFSDCGDKTIQRELLSLVVDGILRKEGERRWSKYILN